MLLKAILSAVLVFAVGYLGAFLGAAGCLLATVAAATGCIVYAIYDARNH